eukprot:54654_1
MGNTAASTIKQNQIADTPFNTKYKLGKHIATGTFATVKNCIRISDGHQFAVKIVKKSECTKNELSLLRDEIDIYSSLNHPHIITLADVYENDIMVEMVLELCNNYSLSDIARTCFQCRVTESDCSHIVQIIGNTLKYLHSKQIVHRDLKPENILFTKANVLKITDFGSAFTTTNRSKYLNHSFSRLPSPSFRMNTMIGTPNYVAPEILQGLEYSYRVDYWSLGVVLFECIAGYHPFSTRKTRKSIGKLYEVIIAGKYKMESVWDSIDNDATDLVKKLLCVDPKERITVDQLLQHKFVMKYAEKVNPFAARNDNESIENSVNDEKNDNDQVNETNKSKLSVTQVDTSATNSCSNISKNT